MKKLSSNRILKGLKNAVKSVLERNPEILDGKTIVFSENCGRKDVNTFQEFQKREENTVKILIYPSKYNNNQFHMIFSDNFNGTYYYSEEIRVAIKKTFGYSTLVSFDWQRDYEMILWTITL